MFFEIQFNLFSIVVGIAISVAGQWIHNKCFVKKSVLDVKPDASGGVDVTSRLGPGYEFKLITPQGEYTYTPSQTNTSNTADVDQGN